MECVDLSIYPEANHLTTFVALRMECVDLSPEELTQIWDVKCRTPHGVRGFKLAIYMYLYHTLFVALRMECVDLSLKNPLMSQSSTVALRMECVDLSLRKKYRC